MERARPGAGVCAGTDPMISVNVLWLMQNRECFYCGREAWCANGIESKRHFRTRLGLTATGLEQRRATREHLRRRADGGDSRPENLVMACAGCNGDRGSTPPLLHLAHKRALHAAEALVCTAIYMGHPVNGGTYRGPAATGGQKAPGGL